MDVAARVLSAHKCPDSGVRLPSGRAASNLIKFQRSIKKEALLLPTCNPLQGGYASERMRPKGQVCGDSISHVIRSAPQLNSALTLRPLLQAPITHDGATGVPNRGGRLENLRSGSTPQ